MKDETGSVLPGLRVVIDDFADERQWTTSTQHGGQVQCGLSRSGGVADRLFWRTFCGSLRRRT
jgi:hypothetical protein